MELRRRAGVDQRLAAAGGRPWELRHRRPVRPLAALEPLQGRFSDACAQRRVDLFPIQFRETAELAQQRLGIAFEPDAVHAHIPFIWSRLNSLGFDFTVNPAAAALAGSSDSVPMETFPSATSVRNLMTEL